jgi:hypothetical protein
MAVAFSRGLSAIFLTLALGVGQAGVCAGWMPTPEARMACCSKHGPCPMHKSDSDDGSAARVITQAEADRCCAASEPDDSAPSSSSGFPVALGLEPHPVPSLLPEPQPRALCSRAPAPIPKAHVPRHVLLSVFLV